MDVKLLKPILLDNGRVGVVGKAATVSEQRGRELIRKGYAAAINEAGAEKSTPPPDDKKALELENLRARAGELGIANAGRLGEAKLRERIKAAEKEASGQPPAEGEQESAEPGSDASEPESEEKAGE